MIQHNISKSRGFDHGRSDSPTNGVGVAISFPISQYSSRATIESTQAKPSASPRCYEHATIIPAAVPRQGRSRRISSPSRDSARRSHTRGNTIRAGRELRVDLNSVVRSNERKGKERTRRDRLRRTLSKNGSTSAVPGVFLQSFIRNMATPNRPVCRAEEQRCQLVDETSLATHAARHTAPYRTGNMM
jgi:hypothetical protein